MNRGTKIYLVVLMLVLLVFFGYRISFKDKNSDRIEMEELEVTVISVTSANITVQDEKNVIYTFDASELDCEVGDSVVIEYMGLLDKSTERQTGDLVSCNTVMVSDSDNIPNEWLDDGIFSKYYSLAYNKLKELTIDEKIGQLLLGRYPDSGVVDDLEKYKLGGFVFYEKDFKDKSEKEVLNMIEELQEVSDIPLLTAVDEEGGKVVRISSNSNLVGSEFLSPRELYNDGGFDLIKSDTIEKSKILSNFGLNLNLAPVVDVSTDTSDYIYERTLGENMELTSIYAKTVIEASKGKGVSYTLKHFPGYDSNQDTHLGSTVDSRTLEDIKTNDLPPFEAGIEAGAEAVLISHNIVNSIDGDNPASMSASVHNLLRNDLDFTGIIITDDMAMEAVSSIDNAVVKAILAGNDIIITTDYGRSFKEIKEAIDNDTISEELVDKLAFRILAWKYYKGLMYDDFK